MALRSPRLSPTVPPFPDLDAESRLRFEILLGKLTAAMAPVAMACWLFVPSRTPLLALTSQLIIPIYVGLGVAAARHRPQLFSQTWFLSLLFALQTALILLQIWAYDGPASPIWLAFLPGLLVGAARWELRGICISLALFYGDRIVTLAGFPGLAAQQRAQQLILEVMVMTLLGITFGFLFRELQQYRERLKASTSTLAESTGVLSAVLQNAGEAVLTVDAANRVSSANWAAGELFTCEPASLLGCPIDRLLTASGMELAELVEESGRIRCEAEGHRRDGTTFIAEVVVTLVVGDGGGVRILVLRDVTELRATTAALSHQALHDGLTGLPNRLKFTQALLDRLALVRKSEEAFSVLFMDLDDFKRVNDTRGHPVGDRVLQAVAQRLRNQLRETDLVARVGGDEFAILPGSRATTADAERIAAKVVQALHEPFFIDEVAIDTGVSVGIANFPEHGRDADSLLGRADSAMYAAKRSGHGWAIAGPPPVGATADLISFSLADLREAVENGELELQCTPVMGLADNALSRVDADVRWRDPRLGLLDAEQFMPIAEESEVIRPLIRYLLRLAVEQQAKWRDAGSDVHVGVRISARNVHDPRLISTVTELLEAHDLGPHNLTLLADEDVALSPAAAEFLREASLSDLRLGVEDHGLDLQSLVGLRSAGFTEIRIPADVTSRLIASVHHAEVVRAAIELAHLLGMTVLAKGVDDESTLDLLRELRCDAVTFLRWRPPLSLETLATPLDDAAIQAVLIGAAQPPSVVRGSGR